jgi:hypothetical protein
VKRRVDPEVEKVRHVVASLRGRKRWPPDITQKLVVSLRRAGLVPEAIAEELDLSDSYVRKILRAGRRAVRPQERPTPSGG